MRWLKCCKAATGNVCSFIANLTMEELRCVIEQLHRFFNQEAEQGLRISVSRPFERLKAATGLEGNRLIYLLKPTTPANEVIIKYNWNKAYNHFIWITGKQSGHSNVHLTFSVVIFMHCIHTYSRQQPAVIFIIR